MALEALWVCGECWSSMASRHRHKDQSPKQQGLFSVHHHRGCFTRSFSHFLQRSTSHLGEALATSTREQSRRNICPLPCVSIRYCPEPSRTCPSGRTVDAPGAESLPPLLSVSFGRSMWPFFLLGNHPLSQCAGQVGGEVLTRASPYGVLPSQVTKTGH